MFFIMGVSPKNRLLPFTQQGICPVCGGMTRFEVRAEASCLTLFFIPVLRFGGRYLLVSTCCGAACELPRALGKAIERGEVDSIDPSQFLFSGGGRGRRCPSCGAEADPSFRFCPHCGAPL